MTIFPVSPAEGQRPIDFEATQSTFDRHHGAAQRWWWGWMGFHVAVTAAQATLFALSDDELQSGALVGTVGSAIGALTLLYPPYPSRWASPALRRAARLDPQTRDAWTEALLQRAARGERSRRGWVAHLGVLAWAAASSFFLWRVRDAPHAALRHGLGALGVGELRIWTMPTPALSLCE